MKVEEYWHGTIKNYRYDGDVSCNSASIFHVLTYMAATYHVAEFSDEE